MTPGVTQAARGASATSGLAGSVYWARELTDAFAQLALRIEIARVGA